MNALIKQYSLNLAYRKSVQVILLLCLIGLGVFTALTYQSFLYLQAQNISQLSVYNEVLKPLTGLVLLFQLLIVSLVCSQLVPSYRAKGQQGVLILSSLSNFQFVTSILFTVLLYGLIPLVYFLLICLFYFSVSSIDLSLIISSSIALIFGLLLITPIVIAINVITKKGLFSSLLSIAVVIGVMLFDELIRGTTSVASFAIYLNVLMQFRDGLVVFSNVINWGLWCGFSFAVMILTLLQFRSQSLQLSWVILVIFAAAILLKGSLTKPSSLGAIDLTEQKLNSLSQQSAKVVSSIEEKITLTAVIDDSKNHDEIKQAFDVLKKYQSNLELNFSNRQELGQKGDYVDQFVTVDIAGQQQSIRYPFDRSAKEALSQMIIQLRTRGNQWITFIEGHGEATPFEPSNRGLSSFYQSLKQLGWPVAMQNLSKQPVVSKNTKILVVAASQQEWLSNEIDSVLDYLKGGGNLLLLREKGDRIPTDIGQFIGVSPKKGTLIDWQGYQSGTPHPAILIINEFTTHPINTGIDSLLAFPWAVGLKIDDSTAKSKFDYLPILKSHIGVWTEFDDQQTELAFNQELGEIKGEMTIAYGVKNKQVEQRMVIIGDSSFLSDSAINNYNNRQFSLNIISWLSAQNVTATTNEKTDNHIEMSPFIHAVLLWGFSVVFPIIFIFSCFVVRFKRNKKTSSLAG